MTLFLPPSVAQTVKSALRTEEPNLPRGYRITLRNLVDVASKRPDLGLEHYAEAAMSHVLGPSSRVRDSQIPVTPVDANFMDTPLDYTTDVQRGKSFLQFRAEQEANEAERLRGETPRLGVSDGGQSVLSESDFREAVADLSIRPSSDFKNRLGQRLNDGFGESAVTDDLEGESGQPLNGA